MIGVFRLMLAVTSLLTWCDHVFQWEINQNSDSLMKQYYTMKNMCSISNKIIPHLLRNKMIKWFHSFSSRHNARRCGISCVTYEIFLTILKWMFQDCKKCFACSPCMDIMCCNTSILYLIFICITITYGGHSHYCVVENMSMLNPSDFLVILKHLFQIFNKCFFVTDIKVWIMNKWLHGISH